MKKQIKAEIIADSVTMFGFRATSFILTLPRYILAELNTHRMFSRNSASSRAVPFDKMLKMVQDDPFIPIAWQKDHPGMQGTEYFTEKLHVEELTEKWLDARDEAVRIAQDLNENGGLTKQICNRLLEPFMWHTAIVTATEWENFFSLRCPQYVDNTVRDTSGGIWRSKKDYCEHFNILENYQTFTQWQGHNLGQGEIHIMALAEAMWDAMNESKPKHLEPGEWHIPFGDKFDEDRILKVFKAGKGPMNILEAKIQIATARCARVSYINFDGSDDYVKDIELHERLSKSGHWSPFEHCAKAMSESDLDNNLIIQDGKTTSGISGNFYGFIQYRKTFSGENKVI